MKDFFYAIAAAAVLLLVVRRRRSGRQPPGRMTVRRLASSLGGFHLAGDTGLVAQREVRERLRGRFFKVITLILLGVVAAAIIIPTLHSSTRPVVKIGVAGILTSTQDRAVTAALAHIDLRGQLIVQPDLASARTALRAGQLTMVIDHGRALVVETPVSSSSTTTASAAIAIAEALGSESAFRAAGLTATQASAVAHAEPLPILSQAPRQKGASRGTAVIGLIFIFILLTQYLTWTLVGVMEEKASRVVEVLLATVRPVQLLAGKVLGIGLAALLQAGLVVAFALILADAVGSDILHGTAPIVVVASLVWLVLAYAFYSWVFAAAGAMAERQDQAQSLSLPLSVPIIVGYVLALVNAGPGPTSLLVKIFAYLPPTAPFAMPLLVAKGEVAWWGFCIASLVSVASTVVVARFAGTVYQRAVLQTGRRIRVREVLARQ